MKHPWFFVLAAGAVLGIRSACFCSDEASSNGSPAGNLRYSISVSKFANEAGWRGRWDIGDAFSTIMTDALFESGKFIVLGDTEMRRESMAEQDLAAAGRTAGGRTAPAAGQMTPAQLLVRGSITHVQETSGSSGGVSVRGLRLGGSQATSEVNITIYLVDSRTGRVKASTNVSGVSNRRGVRVGYYGPKLGGLRGDMGGFLNDNVGKACQDAVAQAVEFLAARLSAIPWQGTVIIAEPERVVINRGTREGVSPGMRFRVGISEELIDPDTGEVLDVSIRQAGEIEVYEARERVAYAKPLSGGELIERNMLIIP